MEHTRLQDLEHEMSGLVHSMQTMLKDVGNLDYSPELFENVIGEFEQLPEMIQKATEDALKISRVVHSN